MNFQELQSIIHKFFKDKDLGELTLKFENPLILTQNEFDELTKNGQLAGGEGDVWITSDEFIFYELSNTVVKLIVHYFEENGFINILEINLFREKR